MQLFALWKKERKNEKKKENETAAGGSVSQSVTNQIKSRAVPPTHCIFLAAVCRRT